MKLNSNTLLKSDQLQEHFTEESFMGFAQKGIYNA